MLQRHYKITLLCYKYSLTVNYLKGYRTGHNFYVGNMLLNENDHGVLNV